jgi:cell wall-associated NlpC family hydrolase
MNPENNHIFATAMQSYTFIVKYLLLFTWLLPLSIYGQNSDKQVDNDLLVVNSTFPTDTIIRKNSKQVDELISFAKTFLGTPYRYAGTTPSGFDCSGFINYVMGNFGLELTHSSYGISEFGETVRLSEIQPGDLMFFKGSNSHSNSIGHVAMVVEVRPDAIMFIHSSTSRGVVIDNFKTSKYFIPRFVKAKRLDYGVKK